MEILKFDQSLRKVKRYLNVKDLLFAKLIILAVQKMTLKNICYFDYSSLESSSDRRVKIFTKYIHFNNWPTSTY